MSNGEEEKISVKYRLNTRDIEHCCINALYNTIYKNFSLNKNTIIYEVLFNNNLKAYIDYDDKILCNKDEAIKKRDDMIVKFIQTCEDDNINKEEYDIFDNSRFLGHNVYKISLHLIFHKYCFYSGLHVKEWVTSLFSNIDIDLSVYKARDKKQLMRLPFTSKEDVDTTMKIVDLYSKIDLYEDPDNFILYDINDINKNEFEDFFITNTKKCEYKDIKLTENTINKKVVKNPEIKWNNDEEFINKYKDCFNKRDLSDLLFSVMINEDGEQKYNYSDWVKIIFIIKNAAYVLNKDLYKLAINFTRLYDGAFNEIDVQKLYNSDIDKDNFLTIAN